MCSGASTASRCCCQGARSPYRCAATPHLVRAPPLRLAQLPSSVQIFSTWNTQVEQQCLCLCILRSSGVGSIPSEDAAQDDTASCS